MYFYNLKLFFESIVNKYRDSIALHCDNKVYTYKELNEKADLFVKYFISIKLNQGDVVSIASSKRFEDFAVMIACLKLGVAYVNLDIDNPADRISSIIKTSNPKIIIGQLDIEVIENNIPIINYDEIDDNYDYIKYVENNFDGETIAYIMFTSGSTGNPKGVAITHQNIIHFIYWIKNTYNINTYDNFANISPMYFDNSVFDFYGSLFNGASITPIKKELLTQPDLLVQYIDNKKCTIWFSVPSMLMYLTTMRVLEKNTLTHIRIFTFGGEGYPKTELYKLYNIYSERAKFINVYGPTECTCICSSYIITDTDFIYKNELPPLGKINQNFSYIIVDDNFNEASRGELCLLGPNVGKGYYNDPVKTSESFVEFINSSHYKKNMYKTGDLVEYKNGLLYFIGRKDNQIKHLGYRVELEEIEVALYSLGYILECAVIYVRKNINYGKIIGYVVLQQMTDSNSIKKQLKDKLPNYMIPSNIHILDKLPKNKNGKIDKKQLKEL